MPERKNNEMDILKIANILSQNRGKNFVERIIKSKEAPTLKNDKDSYSTHSMAWAGPDKQGRSIVYPTVVQEREGDKLVRLSDKEALDYALKNKEYIVFDDPEEADAFSRDYKKYWDFAGGPPHMTAGDK